MSDPLPEANPSANDETKTPATQTTAATAASAQMRKIPDQIARYHVIRLLAEGGMGAVYEAEQENPHRVVALKVIRPGFADEEMIRRFEQESQALGRLQHPGIAQIYEAGRAETATGTQPFIAMEYVHGLPLTEYAQQNTLSARERLRLIQRVCEAVHHAHQRGLIHRDLKPANILVDASGQPKILDFGIAQMTDQEAEMTRQTSVGQLLGTLSYMSPEQMLGDPYEIDTRADVYALGVILYELLSGTRPYSITKKPIHEAAQIIREQEPAPLGVANRAYRGDVETIVHKALEKDKSRRYASAAGLAGDIGRYLNDEPITAHPPSAMYQAGKFARRYRTAVAGIAAVLVVLVGGIAVSSYEYVRARRETATAKAINEFLRTDLLRQASAIGQASGGDADPDIKVRTVLDRAAGRVAGRFPGRPEVEGSIEGTIGQTYLDLGLYSEAKKHLERSLEMERKTFGVADLSTLDIAETLGEAYRSSGDLPRAEALLRDTAAQSERKHGPDDPMTLKTTGILGEVLIAESKFDEAEKLLTNVLERDRRVLGPYHETTLETTGVLSRVYFMAGKLPQAEEMLQRSIEGEKHTLGPEHPDTLTTMNNLAVVYQRDSKYEEAEKLYGEVIAIRSKVQGPQHPETLNSMGNLGVLYSVEGKYGEAEALQKQVLESSRKQLGDKHPSVMSQMSNLAVVNLGEHNYAEAEKLEKQSLELRTKVLGPEHVETLDGMSILGGIYESEGKYSDADPLLTKALELRRKVSGAKHPQTLEMMARVGELRIDQGRFAEAEALLKESLDLQKDATTYRRYWTENLFGASLSGMKRYAEAEPELLAGFEGMKQKAMTVAELNRQKIAKAKGFIQKMYQSSGQTAKAAEWRAKQ